MEAKRLTGIVNRKFEVFAFVRADGGELYFAPYTAMPDERTVLPEGTRISFVAVPKTKPSDKYDRASKIEVLEAA